MLGALTATEHLIRCGYQHIAYIGSKSDPQTFSGRFEGYAKALGRHLRAVYDRLVCQGEYTHESGARCYEALKAKGLPFDAALCENDMIALGVLDRAMRDHRQIPDEFGVVGFDDMFFAGLPMTQLTTMAQPKKKIGEKAATLLLDLITDPDKTRPRSMIYKPELIIRSTTRPLIIRRIISMKMPKSACIEPMYAELPFLDRFQAAKNDGFESVEFWAGRIRILTASVGPRKRPGSASAALTATPITP